MCTLSLNPPAAPTVALPAVCLSNETVTVESALKPDPVTVTAKPGWPTLGATAIFALGAAIPAATGSPKTTTNHTTNIRKRTESHPQPSQPHR